MKMPKGHLNYKEMFVMMHDVINLRMIRQLTLRSYNFQAIWRVFRPSSENLLNLNKFLETAEVN